MLVLEKASTAAGSEGEVPAAGGSETLLASRVRRVGRFGVDLDWKPEGTGGGLRGVPLLCGGMLEELWSRKTSFDLGIGDAMEPLHKACFSV